MMTMRILATALLLVGTLASPSIHAQTGGVSKQFQVVGDVEQKTVFDLKKLKALPVATVNVTYFARGQLVNASFTGALLWDVLRSVGITTDPQISNDILRKFVIVIGSDGYESVFGAGEIEPRFGGAQIMVAYGQNGTLSLGEDGFARIVVPGDKQGGRFVSNIVKIEVRGTDDVDDDDYHSGSKSGSSSKSSSKSNYR